jgi:hypothetical protein
MNKAAEIKSLRCERTDKEPSVTVMKSLKCERTIIKSPRRERADKEPSVTILRKFDLDDFDAHEDAFLNLLAQSFGVLKEPLRYIVCSAMAPTEFVSNGEEQQMYQFPLGADLLSWTTRPFILLIHWAGPGSSLTTRLVKTEGTPIWRGLPTSTAILMEKVS